MRNILNYKLLTIGAIAFGFASCNQDKDVEPVLDASTKPQITFTRVGEGPVTEGSVVEVEITSDKMMLGAVDFTAAISAAAEAAGLHAYDFVVSGASMPAYSKSTIAQITIVEDNVPEPTESWDLNFRAEDIAQNWRLNPNSYEQSLKFDVQNVNVEGKVTIALSWPDEHDDIDMYIFSEDEDDDWGGDDSATGSNPEINMNLWPNDPDGVYYVGINPYHLETGETPYKFSIGFGDGTVQFFEGVFNQEEADAAEWPMDGGNYRLLKITISNGDVTIEHLND